MTALDTKPLDLDAIKARNEKTFAIASDIASGNRTVSRGADWAIAATCSDVDALIAEIQRLRSQTSTTKDTSR